MSDNPAVKQQKETPAENLHEEDAGQAAGSVLSEKDLAQVSGGDIPGESQDEKFKNK